MENAILFGNGFNLLSSGTDSWRSLLQEYSSSDQLLDDIPPTMQYEQVFLTTKKEYNALQNKTKENVLKDSIAERMKQYSSNHYYHQLIDLDVETYLTTNYDHAFYDNNEEIIINEDITEKIYSIRRYKCLKFPNKEVVFYPFHGDVSNSKTIMLGLDQYGGALGKLNNYIKGYYRLKNKMEPIPSMESRLSESISLNPVDYGAKPSNNGLISWIDAFFYMNLHIIGLGLDFSEIDLWWLLTRRARFIQKLGVEKVRNKIYYYCTDSASEIDNQRQKYELLKALHVEVIYHSNKDNLQHEISENLYKNIYSEQINNLKSNL